MKFPDDLPWMIEYRLPNSREGREVTRPALPRKPVESIGNSGRWNAPMVCPQIPLGATHWRRADEKEWRQLKDIPAHWLPFLNRERGTEMDPRPRLEK